MRRLVFTSAIVLVAACASSPSGQGDAPSPTTTAPATTSAATTTPAAQPTAMAPAPVPKGSFVASMADAICSATPPCCAPTGAKYDAAFCKRKVTETWSEHLGESKNYDAAVAAICIADVEEHAAKCMAALGDVLEIASCAQTFQDPAKLAKTGEACKQGADCAFVEGGIAFCWKGSDGDKPGRCALETPGKAGQACFAQGAAEPNPLVYSDCGTDPGLRCGAAGTCVPRAKDGEACSHMRDCAGSAVCRSGVCATMTGKPCTASRACGKKERCLDGKCTRGAKIGEPCGGILDCAEGSCAANTNKCASWSGVWLCKAPE